MKILNRRQQALAGLAFSLLLLSVICIWGSLSTGEARLTDLPRKNMPPSPENIFGTDWLGRDMLARTMKGLSISIFIGILSATVSGTIALALGIAAAVFGKTVDNIIGFGIDLVMGIPHMLLLILISVALGKGLKGVIMGLVFTHWPSLARVIRAEVIQLKESPYIQIARKLGKSNWHIARKHLLPHLLPQFMVGLVLLFPHAILHESGITFLGFGLSTEQPAIGIVLSEAMQYLITGKWWLALFPGLLLVGTVALFYVMGESLQKMVDPGSIHR